jgi:hypothetical protein
VKEADARAFRDLGAVERELKRDVHFGNEVPSSSATPFHEHLLFRLGIIYRDGVDFRQDRSDNSHLATLLEATGV